MVANCNDSFSSILNLEYGYLVEYDIIYLKKLHDYHNDLPLAPENIVINKSLLSPIQQKHKLDKGTRLTPNLCNKTQYKSFLETYLLHQTLGLVTTVHRIVKFNQTPCLQSFIDFNLQKKLETGQDLFK